jgi:hypothetical protein
LFIYNFDCILVLILQLDVLIVFLREYVAVMILNSWFFVVFLILIVLKNDFHEMNNEEKFDTNDKLGNIKVFF